MVSKAVEIQVDGKLLKPAGKINCYLNLKYFIYLVVAQQQIGNLIEISKQLHSIITLFSLRQF